jgi:hypothetical protein
MSDKKKQQTMPGSELRNSRMHVVGMPVEKSENFGLTARRLMGLMAGERILVGIILLLAVVSVALVVSGPRVLGHATDILFNGLTKRNGETEVNFSALHRTFFLFDTSMQSPAEIFLVVSRTTSTIFLKACSNR